MNTVISHLSITIFLYLIRITPSLFYQFLGATKKYGLEGAKDHTGMDSYTFCVALGAKEGNRQLRQHWKTWLTEEYIKRLYDAGVRHVRIPVADWMFVPYAPYEGCFDVSTLYIIYLTLLLLLPLQLLLLLLCCGTYESSPIYPYAIYYIYLTSIICYFAMLHVL
jgi:hypothetical protein